METSYQYPPAPRAASSSPRRHRPNIFLLIFVLFLIAGSFALGFWYGESRIPSVEKITSLVNKESGKPPSIDFSLFWDAWKTVEDKYVDREKIDRQQLVFGAIEGMVKALGDPYSVFFPPEERKQFEEDLSGTFSGIGAEIGMRAGTLTIIAPLPESPAERAGLRAKDKILKIDDESTIDITIEEALRRIRGEEGTVVRLTIGRDGLSDLREVDITRGHISIPPLSVERKSSPGRKDDVAYIRLFQFSEQAPRAFHDAAANILASDAERIIIDVRNNPGGFLDAAVDISSWFLPADDVVVIEVSGDGKRTDHRANKRGQLQDYPVVILVNGGSASASEILAGALRDHRNVPLVGEKTFGKGSVQQLENLRNGTALKITVAKWLTPSGHSISEEGLEPTAAVEMSAEDVESGNDPQLEKALGIVGNLP